MYLTLMSCLETVTQPFKKSRKPQNVQSWNNLVTLMVILFNSIPCWSDLKWRYDIRELKILGLLN